MAKTSAVLDFYESPLKERWSGEQIIKTVEGEVAVTVLRDEVELEDKETAPLEAKSTEPRQSIHVQAKLAGFGAVISFKIWIPRSDRGRVSEFGIPGATEHCRPIGKTSPKAGSDLCDCSELLRNHPDRPKPRLHQLRPSRYRKPRTPKPKRMAALCIQMHLHRYS
jgi:hypothetical protein